MRESASTFPSASAWRRGLALLLLAGGCGGSEGPLFPDPSDRCPAPGAGVTVGGSGGLADTLADPLGSRVSLSYPAFAQPELQGTLVDTHFSERDREGRLLAFLAVFLEEKARSSVVGIAWDEGTALVILEGSYGVFGPAGSAVRLYRVGGPAILQPGAPLSLFGIERVELPPGAQGAWPFDFDAAPGTTLAVQGGGGGGRMSLEPHGAVVAHRKVPRQVGPLFCPAKPARPRRAT